MIILFIIARHKPLLPAIVSQQQGKNESGTLTRGKAYDILTARFKYMKHELKMRFLEYMFDYTPATTTVTAATVITAAASTNQDNSDDSQDLNRELTMPMI